MFRPCIVYLIGISVFLSVVADVQAAVWKPYATNNVFDYSFDAEDMRYPNTVISFLTLKVARGDVVRVWSKKAPKGQAGRDAQIMLNQQTNTTTSGYEDFGYSISQKEIHCNEKTVKLLSETDYTTAGQKLTGFSTLTEYARANKIIPDSEDDALYKVSCGIVAPDSPIVIDDIFPRLPRRNPGRTPEAQTPPVKEPPVQQQPAVPAI